MNNQERKYGIDILKFIAILLVVLVHGLGSANLLSHPVNSTTVLTAVFLRIVSMSSIPLFLLCMGYLNSGYVFSTKYAKRIKPILISYLLAILLTLMMDYLFSAKELTIESVVNEFFNLNVSNYAWYARMYFMFFWMIPFLNKWFNSMESKKETKFFLMILIGIAAFPAVINPLFQEFEINISLPAYFTQLYPLLYYFIGMYIKKHSIEIKKTSALIVALTTILVQLVLFKILYNGVQPNLNLFGSYGSLVNVILATSLFLLFKDIKINSSFFKNIVVYVSKHTFDIYLISHIFDRIIYPIFNLRVERLEIRLLLLAVPVAVTFFSSLLYAWIKDTTTNSIRDIKNSKQDKWMDA